MGSNNSTARNNSSLMGQVCGVWIVEEEHLVSSVEAFCCGVKFRKQSLWAASLECDPLDCTGWGQTTVPLTKTTSQITVSAECK